MVEQYVGKFIPGQLVLCKNCGSMSEDFNLCSRCKKKIPEGAKVIQDKTYKVDIYFA
jgi:hypothetical protein